MSLFRRAKREQVPPMRRDQYQGPYAELLVGLPIYRAEALADDFNRLATYNGEKMRGIVHTPFYAAKMAKVQAEFDELTRRRRAGQ